MTAQPDASARVTTLYGAAATGVSLRAALEAAPVEGGCALLTAPSAYHVARVEGSDCRTLSGPVDLSTVYEARIFTEDAELRWVEAGYAVLLTEDARLLPERFADPVEPLRSVDTGCARYLVWGEAGAPAPGWARFASSRVGALSVPMAAPPAAGRVRLVAREYMVADEAHGNAYVAEERLLGFEPYTAGAAV